MRNQKVHEPFIASAAALHSSHAMKYSRLALVLTSILASLGDVPPHEWITCVEDCAGNGALTSGIRLQGLRALRLDVSWWSVGLSPASEVRYHAALNLLSGLGFIASLQSATWLPDSQFLVLSYARSARMACTGRLLPAVPGSGLRELRAVGAVLVLEDWL